jgi:putative transposase
VTPEDKSETVEQLRESFGRSMRKLCQLVGLNRSSWYYEPNPDNDEPVRERLKELADEHKRWGYRRLHWQLRQEGYAINHKRTERIYREENLMLRVKKRRKMASESRVTAAAPTCRNERWAMEFMNDNLYHGRKFRILNVMDSYSRDYLGFEANTSIPGKKVCSVLDRLVWFNGKPKMITVDNGPEFIGKDLDAWACLHKVKLVFSRPGTPVDNAYVESLNGWLRDEWLNMNWFMSLDHARQVIGQWREEYQTLRPHSGLGGRTPEEFRIQEAKSFQEPVVL